MSHKWLIDLLGFCLHNTYFSFQNKFYEQVEGVAVGSLVSPIVTNLYMQHFEREAIQSASNPPGFGLGIQQRAHKQEFLEYSNSIDPAIKFTIEGTQGNRGIPFLHTLVTPEADNSLSFIVYYKPTHKDQYLQWDSHHDLSAKYSVIGTLTTGLKQSAPNQSYCRRNYYTLGKPWLSEKKTHGPSIGYKINLSIATGENW